MHCYKKCTLNKKLANFNFNYTSCDPEIVGLLAQNWINWNHISTASYFFIIGPTCN